MSGFFSGNDGDFDRVFMTTTDLIDQFVGESLWGMGVNIAGNLGDNTSSTRSSPVQVTGSAVNWKQVACGYRYTAAIKTDGTLWTWGSNATGQLGDNTSSSRSSPVTTVAGGINWKQVSGGSSHATAIKTDGTLWTWGYNATGQLGDNTSSTRLSPVTTVAGGINWKQVSGGTQHTAAIKTDGRLWTWGQDNYGQLGDNSSLSSTIGRSSPVTTAAGGTNWKQVACGATHTVAIKTDGTLWTWGNNFSGMLGDNTSSNRSSPVTTAAGGTNWKQVSCGYRHTAAIKTDGTLWTWGVNSSSQAGALGDNTTVSKSSPVNPVGSFNNWNQVSAGGVHTIGIVQKV